MKLPRIINSLLENDLYKFSMGQAIYHQFSGYKNMIYNQQKVKFKSGVG